MRSRAGSVTPVLYSGSDFGLLVFMESRTRLGGEKRRGRARNLQIAETCGVMK
jgi:hypothetical protein